MFSCGMIVSRAAFVKQATDNFLSLLRHGAGQCRWLYAGKYQCALVEDAEPLSLVCFCRGDGGVGAGLSGSAVVCAGEG